MATRFRHSRSKVAWKPSVAVVLATTLAGCAASTADYSPPEARNVTTERVVRMPFDMAWDRYVSELSKSFFVINNISKNSRIINVSFSSDRPSDFVDCGVTRRTSTHPATGDESFIYQAADSSAYNAGQSGTNILWHFRRNTSLDGRVNIYMAPEGSDSTLIRVNAKYVLAVSVRGESTAGGSYFDQMSVSFTSSAGSGSRADELRCVSKGVLEKQLLELI